MSAPHIEVLPTMHKRSPCRQRRSLPSPHMACRNSIAEQSCWCACEQRRDDGWKQRAGSGFPAHRPHTPRHHLNEKSSVQTGQASTNAVAGHMAQMLLGHACPWPTESEFKICLCHATETPNKAQRPAPRMGSHAQPASRNHRGSTTAISRLLQPARHASGPANITGPTSRLTPPSAPSVPLAPDTARLTLRWRPRAQQPRPADHTTLSPFVGRCGLNRPSSPPFCPCAMCTQRSRKCKQKGNQGTIGLHIFAHISPANVHIIHGTMALPA